MRIGNDERRARLAHRHYLAAKARTADEAAGGVIGLHGSDPSTVFLSAMARMAEPSVKAIETALYDERTLIRMLAMRRTMFVVPAPMAPTVQVAASDQVAAVQRRRYAKLAEEAGLTPDWLEDVEKRVVEILHAKGEAFTREITAEDPRLSRKLINGRGTRHEAEISVSSRVMLLLGVEGKIVRGRPRGAWTTSEYRWAPMTSWLPEMPPPPPVDDARAELVRTWLAAFGPAPESDLRWWTGWTAAQIRAALAKIGPEEVELDDGSTGLVLPGDTAPSPAPEPWVAFLPGLDPTAMGWKERAWYLGDHEAPLFDRNGNIGPTIWWNGRIVGGWAQRKEDGEIVWRFLEDAGSEAAAAAEAEAARLRERIGDVRVTPRFRTPLERELSA